MRSNRHVLAVVLAGVGAALGGCDRPAATEPARPAPLPPLSTTLWHAHHAEGQALPALVAHRLEQGALVQDFLDSAQLQITAQGSWERRLFLTRFRAGAYDRAVASQEIGTWVATDSGYLFTAAVSGRVFVLTGGALGDSLRLPLRGETDGGMIVATLRTSPPTPSVVGEYRATEVRGQPLPAAMYVFPDYEEAGRRMSIHLVVDSATLRLLPNGRYEHAIHYREWEGPVGGAPTSVRYRFVVRDFGSFTRENTLIRFESGWLQNHRFDGTVYRPELMELLHGISHGDAPVPLRYARR